jgi:hypothetical protein
MTVCSAATPAQAARSTALGLAASDLSTASWGHNGVGTGSVRASTAGRSGAR